MIHTLSQNRIYGSLVINSNFWIIHDRPQRKTKQRILEQYMLDTQDVLVEKVSMITNWTRPFTKDDENRTRATLDLLIEARKTWQEEPK